MQSSWPNAPPNAAITLQSAEFTSGLALPFSIVGLLIGLTYPVICLILLRTPGARVACLGPAGKTYPPTQFSPTDF